MTEELATKNMIRPAFTPGLEEDRDKNNIIIPIKLNLEEQAILKECRVLFKQPKDSTCIKQLMLYAFKSISSQENKYLAETISNNIRKNKRSGFNEIE